jgi:hypothetical protein
MNGHHYPRKWEIITENFERLKVPGGWIVHNSTTIIIRDKDIRASECMIFVNDKDYEWSLEP